jgi:membrane protein required for colicin V production
MDIAQTLNGFDWVVITLIGLLALGGLMRGFTTEALSLAGWIGAAVVVRLFHEQVTGWLAPRVGGEASGAIIAFLLLFFGTVIAAKMLAGAVGGAARRSALGPMDRLLGLGFGGLKGVILSSVLFLLIQFGTGLFDPSKTPPDWLLKSRSAPLLALSANAMVGWVQDLQKDEEPAGMAFPLPPGATLPPGHPQLEGPFGGQMQPEDPGGYSPADREALDKLLDEGEAKGEQVAI